MHLGASCRLSANFDLEHMHPFLPQPLVNLICNLNPVALVAKSQVLLFLGAHFALDSDSQSCWDGTRVSGVLLSPWKVLGN